MRSRLMRRVLAAGVAASCAAGLVAAQQPAGPKFRADDPLSADDDRAVDAGRVSRDMIGGWSDFMIHTFFPAVSREDRRAENVNTIDEVPDSSWFTNRLGSHPMPLEDIVRGPDRVDRLRVEEWVIVEGKDTGRQPGFRAVDASDPSRQVYQLEFDPPGNPELATGAEIVGTAVYHALGYNVVDVYLVELDRAKLRISPDATVTVNGRTRSFTPRDLDRLLRNVARKPNGRYRALASRFAEGRNVGPFRYYGTRPDDPNDIYPHEHRRELRGNRVFAAWLNHDDSRAINTLDMLEGPPGRQAIRHYMFDFGSIMGSGTDGDDHAWVGHEQVVDGGPAWRTLLSLGVYRRPYLKVRAPADLPAAGNFTADGFEPATWRPHYRNPAFENMRPDDAFWAAKKLAALTPEAIAAIVRKAEYTDPRVSDYIAGTLTRRRLKVLRTWLAGVNPISEPRVEGNRLEFVNAAVAAGVATPNARYQLAWFALDNERSQHHFLQEVTSVTTPEAAVPPVLASSPYIGAEIRTFHPDFPGWATPVRVYFRKSVTGWTTVGLERGARHDSVRLAAR